MKTNHSTIRFNATDRLKNWELPAGDYLAVFEEYQQEDDIHILKFRILDSPNPIEDYWARQRYRPEDKWKLLMHLRGWLGVAEYTSAFEAGALDITTLYGRKAAISVSLLRKTPGHTPLRVIDAICPPDSLVTTSQLGTQVSGEFNI